MCVAGEVTDVAGGDADGVGRPPRQLRGGLQRRGPPGDRRQQQGRRGAYIVYSIHVYSCYESFIEYSNRSYIGVYNIHNEYAIIITLLTLPLGCGTTVASVDRSPAWTGYYIT